MTGVKAISCRLSPQYSSTAKRASTYCEDKVAKFSASEPNNLAIKSVSISPPYNRGHVCRRIRIASSLQLSRARVVADARGTNWKLTKCQDDQLSFARPFVEIVLTSSSYQKLPLQIGA